MSNAPGRLPPGAARASAAAGLAAAASLRSSSVAVQKMLTAPTGSAATRNGTCRPYSAEHAAEAGPEHEADAERDADHAERLRAVLRLRVIGDVGLGERQVAGGDAVEDAADEHHPQRVRPREHDEAQRRAGLADQQHAPAAEAVGQVADDRRRDQRAHRVDRHERRRDERRGAEFLGVERRAAGSRS